jgi:hypothetical protein
MTARPLTPEVVEEEAAAVVVAGVARESLAVEDAEKASLV